MKKILVLLLLGLTARASTYGTEFYFTTYTGTNAYFSHQVMETDPAWSPFTGSQNTAFWGVLDPAYIAFTPSITYQSIGIYRIVMLTNGLPFSFAVIEDSGYVETGAAVSEGFVACYQSTPPSYGSLHPVQFNSSLFVVLSILSDTFEGSADGYSGSLDGYTSILAFLPSSDFGYLAHKGEPLPVDANGMAVSAPQHFTTLGQIYTGQWYENGQLLHGRIINGYVTDTHGREVAAVTPASNPQLASSFIQGEPVEMVFFEGEDKFRLRGTQSGAVSDQYWFDPYADGTTAIYDDQGNIVWWNHPDDTVYPRLEEENGGIPDQDPGEGGGGGNPPSQGEGDGLYVSSENTYNLEWLPESWATSVTHGTAGYWGGTNAQNLVWKWAGTVGGVSDTNGRIHGTNEMEILALAWGTSVLSKATGYGDRIRSAGTNFLKSLGNLPVAGSSLTNFLSVSNAIDSKAAIVAAIQPAAFTIPYSGVLAQYANGSTAPLTVDLRGNQIASMVKGMLSFGLYILAGIGAMNATRGAVGAA